MLTLRIAHAAYSHAYMYSSVYFLAVIPNPNQNQLGWMDGWLVSCHTLFEGTDADVLLHFSAILNLDTPENIPPNDRSSICWCIGHR